MTDKELQQKVSEALSAKSSPSAQFESRLFANAQELLAERREYLEERRAFSKKVSRWIYRIRSSPWEFLAWATQLLVINPGVQAAALLLLASAAILIHSGPRGRSTEFSDLPDFPKFNDAPARYDAERQVERQAYEREVEDAHIKTSGGL